MTPQEIEHRANEAKRLLSEPILNEALDAMERHAIDQMVSLPYEDLADRQRRMLADQVKVIRGFRAYLEAAVLSGKDAVRERPTLP